MNGTFEPGQIDNLQDVRCHIFDPDGVAIVNHIDELFI